MCCYSFALYCVDKVTTEIYSFVSVIATAATWFATVLADIEKFEDQVRIKWVYK